MQFPLQNYVLKFKPPNFFTFFWLHPAAGYFSRMLRQLACMLAEALTEGV